MTVILAVQRPSPLPGSDWPVPLSFGAMLDRQWLLGEARAEREALGRTVQYTDPARWEADSPNEGWRLKDVVAHLAASEMVAAAIIADEPPTELDEYRKSLEGSPVTIDGWNDWSVARRRDEAALTLAVEWGRAADLFLVRASKVSSEDWEEKTVQWTAGEMRIGYLVQYRLAEWWAHGEDVREGSGLAPRLEHPPIYCVNDLAVRLIPYGLGLQGESFPGRTVRIELEGVGEGEWLASLGAGEAPVEGRRPDAYIAGRGHAFASVAAGRADPDVCLYEGILQVGGDIELCDAVLKSLRSYP
jgi:uncharacterized protein (TIGR03083 family)